jgi:hypothetical protein
VRDKIGKIESEFRGTRGSASTAGVRIEANNCGKVHVSKGVTFENQDEVAASFKAGSEYEFDLCWFSRVVKKDIRQEIPSVQDYRLVDCWFRSLGDSAGVLKSVRAVIRMRVFQDMDRTEVSRCAL